MICNVRWLPGEIGCKSFYCGTKDTSKGNSMATPHHTPLRFHCTDSLRVASLQDPWLAVRLSGRGPGNDGRLGEELGTKLQTRCALLVCNSMYCYSLSPTPQTNPSADCFQYHTWRRKQYSVLLQSDSTTTTIFFTVRFSAWGYCLRVTFISLGSWRIAKTAEIGACRRYS